MIEYIQALALTFSFFFFFWVLSPSTKYHILLTFDRRSIKWDQSMGFTEGCRYIYKSSNLLKFQFFFFYSLIYSLQLH